MTELVLASKSPRRRQLLAALGVEFSVHSADIVETALPGETPQALVMRLCRGKAAAVAGRHPRAVILAADTLVVLAGNLLGKPADAAEAVAMLTALRGRMHTVETAICVIGPGGTTTRLSTTRVHMRAYTDREIAAYVATGDPLDKAGAYGIQDPQFVPVAAWDGCYSAVMGLPLGLTAELLTQAGLAIEQDVRRACSGQTGDRCCL